MKQPITDTHRENIRKALRKAGLKRKLLVVKKLSGKCVFCGFNDYRALQIDHIHGNGNAERKKLGAVRIYYKILNLSKTKVKKEYQLLCANCNWIKRYTNDECKKIKNV